MSANKAANCIRRTGRAPVLYLTRYRTGAETREDCDWESESGDENKI